MADEKPVEQVMKKVMIDTRKDDRGYFDILSLTPGKEPNTDPGIDIVSDMNMQSIQVIHTPFWESSLVELRCLDENGKMQRATVTTDDYPKITGIDTPAARLSIGNGDYILDAIKNSTGKDPQALIEELAKSPHKVTLESNGKSPLDEICAGPVGQAILKSGRDR